MFEDLWNKETEKQFFIKATNDFASLDQLFYRLDNNHYIAYWPKGYKGKKTTLQSRNSLIGNYTEKWCQKLIQKIVEPLGLFSMQSIVSPEIGLTRASKGDLAISRINDHELNPEDILVIFEIKMSIVWNWKLQAGLKIDSIGCNGDFTTHQGNPSILRSDSMLKAIGKSINIRVSSNKSAKIPIIIIGNSPITEHYYSKVDNLKERGVIQGFWSLNPSPLNNYPTSSQYNIKHTDKYGFQRIDTLNQLEQCIDILLNQEVEFFSAMKEKSELGKLIEIANKEKSYEEKAEKFLNLIREV